MKRLFIVAGYRPAHSKEANDLLRAFDLGIDGAFIPFVDTVRAEVRDDVTPEQWERQPEGLRAAYEQVGCVHVRVVPIEEEARP